MLDKIQKMDIAFKVWKFCKLREFVEAITILGYAIKTGKFPHGDAEYAQILNQEV